MGLLTGLLFQLHYFTITIAVGYLISLYWIYFQCNLKKNEVIKNLIIFTVAAILPNLSFVIFDLKHEFFYFKIIKEMFFADSNESYICLFSLDTILNPFSYSFNVLKGLFSKIGLVIILFLLLFSAQKNLKLSRSLSNLSLKRAKKSNLPVYWFLGTGLSFLLLTMPFPSLLNDYHSAFFWCGVIFLIVKLIPTKKIFILGYIIIAILMILENNLFREPIWSENLPKIREITQVINNDIAESGESNYNIAAFTDADTRGIRYRYFLIKAGHTPQNYDQYANNKIIYVITPNDEEHTKLNPAWEISYVKNSQWIKLGEVQTTNIFKAIQ